MMTPNATAQTLEFKLPSDLECVYPMVQTAEAFIAQFSVMASSRITLVLRELLVNAIVHGNQNVCARSVQCRIEHAGQGLFRIMVEDEGEGFDYRNLDTTIPDDPRKIHNRGFILIRKICQTVKFNDRGNQITVLISAPESILGGTEKCL